MRVVRVDEVEWAQNKNSHRGGGLSFKTLLTGIAGAPECYWLTYSKSDGHFFSPRHRHNFDQFRICIEGRTSIDPKKYLEPGEVGYFPEGTAYGPQQDTEEHETLVLQFGAASGSGFLGREEIRGAQEALNKLGEFKDGVFRRTNGEGRKNQDGFEALWEHAMGRKLEYPPARYENPIYMKHDNFTWQSAGWDGVLRKTLGTFTERETRLEMIRLAAGAEWTSPVEDAIGLTFVMTGSGTCDAKKYEMFTAAETTAGERGTFRAASDTQMFRMVLPMLRSVPARRLVAW